jgi:hypothetical protein
MRLQRRWVRDDFNGKFVRLDDLVIQAHFEIYRVKEKRRADLMGDLLAMEEAAIEVLNSER